MKKTSCTMLQATFTDLVGVVGCLSAMVVNGEEGDLLQYKTKWVELVNRGGLFEITRLFLQSL